MSTIVQNVNVHVSHSDIQFLKWLHISDLHFGQGRYAHSRVDQEMVVEELLHDATQVRKLIGSPDFVFLTGDVAFSADPAEYAVAAAWTDRLLEQLGVDQENLYIVPGNHDVDRRRALDGPTHRFIHTGLRQTPETIDDYLARPTELEQLWTKLKAFSDFARPYGPVQVSYDFPFWTHAVDTLMGPVEIVGLNTVLLSFDDADRGSLTVGKHQLKVLQDRQRFRIVLQHHPPQWLRDGDELNKILSTRPHVLLCGHIHEQQVQAITPMAQTGLLRFVGGSGHEDAARPLHAYNWGRVSSEGIDWFPRLWNHKTRSFGPDYSNPSVGRDQYIRYTREDIRAYSPATFAWLPGRDSFVLTHVESWIADSRGQWHLTTEKPVKVTKDSLPGILDGLRAAAEDANVSYVGSGDDNSLIFSGSEDGYDTLRRSLESDRQALCETLGFEITRIDRVQGATVRASVSQDPGESPPSHSKPWISTSEEFVPPLIRGCSINPSLSTVSFIIDTGDKGKQIDKEEFQTLVSYFFSSLSFPEDDFWVNLSAYESRRMIPQALGRTKLGRDMLAQDCVLKKLCASLLHPSTPTGQRYWAEFHSRVCTSDGAASCFQKVWMQPKVATVYEKPAGKEEPQLEGNLKVPKDHSLAYVCEAEIGIFCEEDVIAAHAESASGEPALESRRAHAALFRDLIVPVIHREVNNGRNFSAMRQIYNAMILATWFRLSHGKSQHSPSFIGSRDSSLVFATTGDHSFVRGESSIISDGSMQIATSNDGIDLNELYYQEYLQLFREGLRQTEQIVDVTTGQVTRRTYMSGRSDLTEIAIRSTSFPFGLRSLPLHCITVQVREGDG